MEAARQSIVNGDTSKMGQLLSCFVGKATKLDGIIDTAEDLGRTLHGFLQRRRTASLDGVHAETSGGRLLQEVP